METTPRLAVFTARQLTKLYRMGEVDVRALDGVDLDLFERQGLLEQDGVIARARAMVELFTAKVDAKSR